MREQLKMRIDEVIACVNRRIAAGQSVHEALAELRRLAGVAYRDGFNEGFVAGRDGAVRPGLDVFEPQRWHCRTCNTHIGCTEGTADRAIREHANVCEGVLERLP